MSFFKRLALIAIVCLILLCLQATVAAAANEDAGFKWNDPRHVAANVTTEPINGCVLNFNILNNTAVYVTFMSGSYGTQGTPLGLGKISYSYNGLLIVKLLSIDEDQKGAWVSIGTPDSQGNPTPVPGGTKLTCDTPGLQALAGDTVTFPITIQNNNNEDITYTLSASSGTGWALRFVSGDKGLYKLYVPRMSSKTVTLEVKTSGATGVGEKKVTASVDSQSIDVFVYITSVNQSAQVTASVSSKIASIGDKITYDIKIKNLQTQENIYRLSASGLPENWYYRYKESISGTEELSETVVPAGGEKNLVLEIVPPYSVAAGDYNFTATVTEPGGNLINRDFMLRLKSGVGMTMQSPKQGYDAKPGQPFTIDVYVTNSGSGTALTNLYLETTAPDGWIVQSTPNKTTSLTAGNTQKFTVKVTPPGNIVASDYDITIKAVSDQAGKEKDYNIKVTVDSYIPYIGGAIILFVVGGLVLVYRKYGRR
jgi:uncharacterized membrane protein